MGDVHTTPGGSGADLDAVTASAPDVYPGKVIVGADGEPITGTMPTQGGSTITPGTSSKTVVSAGRYVTGNVVLAGDRNFMASNIRTGVPIFGLTGTWEGYVSPIVFINSSGLTKYSANGVTPMLYKGETAKSNSMALTAINGYVEISAASINASTGALRWSGGVFNNAIVVSAYNYVSITFTASGINFGAYYVSAGLSTDPRAFSQNGPNATAEYQGSSVAKNETLTFNISNISGWQYLLLYVAGRFTAAAVYRLKIIEIRFY